MTTNQPIQSSSNSPCADVANLTTGALPSAESLFARQEWINACRFIAVPQAEALNTLVSRIESTRNGVVILDIDHTLLLNSPRTLAIVAEFLEKYGNGLPAELDTALNALTDTNLNYTLQESIRALGFKPDSERAQEAETSLYQFWKERFFSNDYLHHDIPVEGASTYCHRLQRAAQSSDSTLVYVTGRDEPNMGVGTRASLKLHGFPTEGDSIRFILKPRFEIPDLKFKSTIGPQLRALGTVVGSFENEPINFAALVEQCSNALHYFVETCCSSVPAPALRGVYRLKDFRV